MNWKKGFREIAKALFIVAAICGWLFGLNLAEMLFYDEALKQWSRGGVIASPVLGITGAAVGALSVWFAYKLLERLILGYWDKNLRFFDNNPKANQKQ